MARNMQPVLKKCRTLGLDPVALGVNKKSNRNIRPNANKKLTEYGTQLREKQKAKFVYGVMEKQFYKLYEEATRKEGVTGELLLQYLERRLDNVVYRLGLGSTRRQARQLVNHGHVLVDGKKVDIASYAVKPGQVVSVREKSRNLEIIKEAVEITNFVPEYLTFDADKLEGSLVRLPERSELHPEINEQLIVEYYSR